MAEAADLILHHAPGSRSVRVLWLLRELGLPHQLVERPLVEWVMDRDYRKVNPSGRLPYVVDRGQPRTESLALMQTLIESRQPDSAPWRPIAVPGTPSMREGLASWCRLSPG